MGLAGDIQPSEKAMPIILQLSNEIICMNLPSLNLLFLAILAELRKMN